MYTLTNANQSRGGASPLAEAIILLCQAQGSADYLHFGPEDLGRSPARLLPQQLPNLFPKPHPLHFGIDYHTPLQAR
jgi:hypothetical protein